MTEVASQIEIGSIPEEGAKLRLLTMGNLDGRTLAVRRIKEWESQIEADLGGNLTEAQKSIPEATPARSIPSGTRKATAAVY